MHRVSIQRPGGYDRLTIIEAPDPQPGPGEVVIDVVAAGINLADCFVRMGLYASAKQYAGYPITPGFEVAGRVIAVGEDVAEPELGAPVLALTLFGGYTTRLRVSAGQVVPLPAGWSFAEAAGFPTAFLTAWYALHELGQVRTGDRVLVHSAAGGVGQALVQLSRRAGAEVIGIVGASHKRAVVERLGARVIDKSVEDLWAETDRQAPGGFDIVLDANGFSTLGKSYRRLGRGGRLVIYGFHEMFRKQRSGGASGRVDWLRLAWARLRTPRFGPLELVTENRAVLGFNLSFMAERQQLLRRGLDTLMASAAAGEISPLPITRYPFKQVSDAQRDLESGQTSGKLVLMIDPSTATSGHEAERPGWQPGP